MVTRTIRPILMMSSVLGLLTAGAAFAQEAPRPANAASLPATEQGGGGSGAEAASGQSNDVIVTAQRREQTLIEVPQSISVIGGESLERLQAKTFLDYAALVPGLNVTQDNPGESRLVLRGINTGSVGSTVAVYVDDVPFGQSGSLANGGVLAGDFDTFDVSRIEVLRGPQGTLYGSNSLGGVLKYVTNAPSTTKVEARAQGGFESVSRGGTGYLGNAMINLPLGDTLAVRASGFYHRTPGYLDTTGRSGRDVDRAASYGGRASLLFKPTDRLSIRLTGIIQNIDVDSPSAFDADPVSLRPVSALTGGSTGDVQTRFERLPERHDIDYRLYSGTIDYDAGFATLSSITSYATQRQDQITDITNNAFRNTAGAIYGAGNGGAANVGLVYANNAGLKKVTEEVRLVTPKSTVFDLVVGGYFTRETSSLNQDYLPVNIATGALIPTATSFAGLTFDRLVYATLDAHYRELAGYANGTLHLGPRFDLTLGGRYSDNRQDDRQAIVQLGTGTPISGRSGEGVFTWSVAPRYAISGNASVYARVAKGYRPGGPNFIPAGAPAGFPAEFAADTLVSYEAGVKAQTADRSFSIDASGFYVDWDNILILSSAQSAAGPVGVNSNGRRARTYGGEATATMRPVRGFEVSANLAYTKAYLRGDTTPPGGGANLAGGLSGDDLPFVPRWSGTMSADYRWSMGDFTAFVGGDIHLQSDQKAGFSAEYRAVYGRQITLDGYAAGNLRAGAAFGRFTVQAYLRNVTDSQGLINASGYPYTVPPTLGGTGAALIRATSIRPRTVGATVGFAF